MGSNRFAGVFSFYSWSGGAAQDENLIAMYEGDGRECFFGILQEGGVAGDVRPVAIAGGVSRVHSGLTPGARYYLTRAATIEKPPTVFPVGTAISATELAIDSTIFNAALQST